MGYLLVVHVLCKGWLCFEFWSQLDAKLFFSQAWLWGPLSLVLKHWHLAFDLSTEPFVVQHLWELLPRCSVELWNVRDLEALGKLFGKIVLVDKNSLLSVDKRVARDLVEVNISKGLIL